MKNKIKRLEKYFDQHEITSISIYAKGLRVASIEKPTFQEFKNDIFIFNVNENQKYIIDTNEIEEITYVPTSDLIIILVYFSRINKNCAPVNTEIVMKKTKIH